MVVRFKNDVGLLKEAKDGFSWTTLFFGLFVPLLRGDLKNAIIMLIVGVLTCGISWLVFPFFYNKTYIKSLLMQGFKPATQQDKQILINKGYLVNEENDNKIEVKEVIKENIKEIEENDNKIEIKEVEIIDNKINENKEEAREN